MNNETFAGMVGQSAPACPSPAAVVEDPEAVATAEKMIQAGDLYRYAKHPHQHVAIPN